MPSASASASSSPCEATPHKKFRERAASLGLKIHIDGSDEGVPISIGPHTATPLLLPPTPRAPVIPGTKLDYRGSSIVDGNREKRRALECPAVMHMDTSLDFQDVEHPGHVSKLLALVLDSSTVLPLKQGRKRLASEDNCDIYHRNLKRHCHRG